MRKGIEGLWGALAILLAGCAADPTPISELGKARLEWKLREGDRFTLRVQTKIHSAPVGEGIQGGQVRLARQESSIDGLLEGRVLDRNSEGEIRAHLTLKEVRVKDLSEGFASEFEWADGAVRKSEGQVARLYEEQLRKTPGPSGEMFLSKQGRMRFPSGDLAQEVDSLARIAGIVALVLPEQPSAPGDSWEERYEPVKSVLPFPEILQKLRWEKWESVKGRDCARITGEGSSEAETYGFRATAASSVVAHFDVGDGILADCTRDLTLRVGEESEGESGWKVRTVCAVQFARN